MQSVPRSPTVRPRLGRTVPAVAALLALAPAAAAGQGTIRGTVHAPPGEDVRGAVIIACYAENGRCNFASPHPNSRAIEVVLHGASARYRIENLVPGEYVMLGTHDINGSGTEDDGDWIAQHADLRPVRPPAQGIDMHFVIKATPVPVPPATLPPSTAFPGTPVVPAPASFDGPRLHGLYRRIASVSFGMSASQLTSTYVAFFPDGRYIWGLYPSEGLDQLDWSYWCATDTHQCGTYHVEQVPGTRPGRVRLNGRPSQTRPASIEIAGSPQDRFVTVFEPFDRLDGLRLGSRYAANCHNGYEAVVEFTRDGAFAERGLLGCVHWPSFRGSIFADPTGYNARKQSIDQRPGGVGRYSFQDNTLELRYQDGRVVRLGIHASGEPRAGADPQEICPAEHCLRRVQ